MPLTMRDEAVMVGCLIRLIWGSEMRMRELKKGGGKGQGR